MIANYSDTVCAPATSVGTGAVSVIRISGPESLRIVDKVVRFRSGIASDVLADDIVTGSAEGYVKEWDINGEKVTLGVKKA